MVEIDLYKQVDILQQFQIQLNKFKKLRHNVWAFRCPYCGDSKTNINKRRGYIFEHDSTLFFKCFNCGDSKSLMGLVKDLDPSLYKESIFEILLQSEKKETKREKPTTKLKAVKKNIKFPSLGAESISSLSSDHLGRMYLEGRLLNDYFDRLYYTDSIHHFMMKNHSAEEASRYPSEPAIIIPLININKEIIGYQFRTLFSKVRYYTVSLNNAKLVFGADNIDISKPVYICEGPFDSMFIDNCIAAMSSDLTGALSRLSVDIDPIFIFDNEPWNTQITKLMKKTIENGYKIAFWNKPETYGKKEDINDMIIRGKKQCIVDLLSNVYSGLDAYVQFGIWIG